MTSKIIAISEWLKIVFTGVPNFRLQTQHMLCFTPDAKASSMAIQVPSIDPDLFNFQGSILQKYTKKSNICVR